MKTILATICIMLIMCSKKTKTPFPSGGFTGSPVVIKTGVVVLDGTYYMEKIKFYARQCKFNVNCMNNKIAANIPKKYYVHVRRIKSGWEFACIDTTVPGHEKELKKATYAAMGY